MTQTEILNKIDRIHEKGLDAIRDRNFESYMSIFAEDLSYKQLNGKVIDKKRLTNDQKRYFSRIVSANSSYQRITYTYNNDLFSETLQQEAEISIRVFAFFKKTINVMRKATYDWSKIKDDWKIINVEILEEQQNQD